MITKEYLDSIFSFDSATGFLKWKIARSGINSGKQAGSKNDQGYRRVMIDGKEYRVHRLLWILHYGDIPEYMQIDHINGIRDDNRIDNLRIVTPSVNAQNKKKALKNNKLGVMGVHRTESGRYIACLQTNKKVTYHGTFDTPDEAHKAYLNAKRMLHEGCTI